MNCKKDVENMQEDKLYGVLVIANDQSIKRIDLYFELQRPEPDEKHYGTGCYMAVIVNGSKEDIENIDLNNDNTHYIDVRYERTTDLKELAKRWVDGYYGDKVQNLMTSSAPLKREQKKDVDIETSRHLA